MKEVEKLNIQVKDLEKKYQDGDISLNEIRPLLEDIWLPKNTTSRIPNNFQELYVPECFSEIFDDIFIDF